MVSRLMTGDCWWFFWWKFTLISDVFSDVLRQVSSVWHLRSLQPGVNVVLLCCIIMLYYYVVLLCIIMYYYYVLLLCCIRNDDFCIQNDEFCIQNVEISSDPRPEIFAAGNVIIAHVGQSLILQMKPHPRFCWKRFDFEPRACWRHRVRRWSSRITLR